MSDVSQGQGWWLASDGKWYPPQEPAAPQQSYRPSTGPPPGCGVPTTPVQPVAEKSRKKWPFVVAGLVVLLLIGVAGGGSSGDEEADLAAEDGSTAVTEQADEEENEPAAETTTTAPPTTTTAARSFDSKNYAELAADPDRFKGSNVSVVGKIFGEVEPSGESVGFQMFADPKNSEFNTIVLSLKSVPVKTGDFVRVDGVVMGEQSGKNGFGATVTAVMVKATNVEVVDAVAAASPAERTARGASQSQHGLTVAIDKIDFAADETRVFVTVTNGTPTNASFYSFNAKATQGSQQFDEGSSFNDYPEVSSDLLPGVKSSGVITFPPIGPGPVSFFLEARTDNYRLDFEPFKFDLSS